MTVSNFTNAAEAMLPPRATRVCLTMLAACAAAFAFGQPTGVVAVDLVSLATSGRSGNAASNGVVTNVDGSVIAFYSDASNLVPGDTNQVRDIFVRDLRSGTTHRVNLGQGSAQANAPSHAAGGPPALSGDGTIVVFYSSATNLVEKGDTNGFSDIFVYDRSTERLTMISLTPGGQQANGDSLAPDIDAAGRFIAYQSLASNLVDGDTNGVSDIFVHDRVTGTTERACGAGVEPNGSSFSPSISACGQFVAFASAASNLVEGDSNRLIDVFVCNRRTGEIDRVSVGDGGRQGNGISILPDISGSGCFVAFKSEASNLVPDDRNNRVDVFLRNRGAGVTELISEAFSGGSANDASFPPSITSDGRFVAFGSAATNLLIGDVNSFPSLYVRDRLTGAFRLVDVNDAGQQANGGTPDVPPSISGDGTQIGFVSAASNLTPPGVDLNSTNDVFRSANLFEPVTFGDTCCDCDDDTCKEPELGVCPLGCVPVCDAVCLPGPGVPGSRCAPLTPPSPTPTHTSGTPTVSATPSRSMTPTPTSPTNTPTATGPVQTSTPTAPPHTATPTPRTTTPTPTAPTATATTPTATPTGTMPTATATGATATPAGPTATATATLTGRTATPTRTRGTPSPDRTATVTAPRRFDDDSCAVVPLDRRTRASKSALLLIAPLLVLILRRR